MAKPLNKLMAKSSNGEDITFYRNKEGINYSAYPHIVLPDLNNI